MVEVFSVSVVSVVKPAPVLGGKSSISKSGRLGGSMSRVEQKVANSGCMRNVADLPFTEAMICIKYFGFSINGVYSGGSFKKDQDIVVMHNP